MRAARCVCWISIVALAAACSRGEPVATNPDVARFVDSVAADAMRDGLVPSLSIAITQGSDFVLEKTYGRSDVENDVRSTNETVYRIASITKQFTAAAILRLAEQGRVDLDADITQYLHGGSIPGFSGFIAWYPADDVTIAVLQNSGAAPLYDGYVARRLARRLLRLPDPARSELEAGEGALTPVVGTYRIGAASIEVRRESLNVIVGSADAFQVWDTTFQYQGAGVFASLRNPEFGLRFGGGGGQARGLSLTLSGRALGDAVYDSTRK